MFAATQISAGQRHCVLFMQTEKPIEVRYTPDQPPQKQEGGTEGGGCRGADDLGFIEHKCLTIFSSERAGNHGKDMSHRDCNMWRLINFTVAENDTQQHDQASEWKLQKSAWSIF